MDRTTIDEYLEVRRVMEWRGPIRTVGELFPDTPASAWQENRDWLSPTFWDPATDAYEAAIQTWVLRAGGRTVLVDTGIGDDRDRPQVPQFSGLRTGFLDRLAEAGVAPEDVDVVVNTHIHYDHVGWNTRAVDGGWRPTFPNATYLVPRADHDYFHPDNAAGMRAPETEDEQRRFDGIRLVFADSIAPVVEAGQVRLWDGEYRISETLVLRAAPGHTPGSSVLWHDGPRPAAFVGDLLHTPLQMLVPERRCAFDLDADRAHASRREVLTAAAERGARVFPAHLGGCGAATVVADGPDLAIDGWVDLPPR